MFKNEKKNINFVILNTILAELGINRKHGATYESWHPLSFVIAKSRCIIYV